LSVIEVTIRGETGAAKGELRLTEVHVPGLENRLKHSKKWALLGLFTFLDAFPAKVSSRAST
jgi:hypothetical protein